MKINTMAAIAAAFAMPCALAGVAQAADASGSSATLEVGYTRSDFHASPSFGFNTIDVRGGFQFGKYVGAELQAGFGVGSDTVDGVDVKQKWEVSVYAVGFLPLNPDLDLLARVGYGRTRAEVSSGGFSDEGEDKGAAAGVGLRWFPKAGSNGVRLDYTHYFYQDDANAFTVNYVHKF